MNEQIRVLVVDDECMVNAAIGAMLSTATGITVVGNADSAAMCLQQAFAHRPHVILLDLHLPDKPGTEVIRPLLEDNPNVCIIILTGYAEEHEVALALRAGAVGFLFKSQAPRELVQTIESAYAGNATVSPQIAKIMLQMLNPAKPTQTTEALSASELRVLVCIAHGLSNKEIAHNLGVCQSTVHTHVNHILCKLNLENRTLAAIYAVKQGLVSLALHRDKLHLMHELHALRNRQEMATHQ